MTISCGNNKTFLWPFTRKNWYFRSKNKRHNEGHMLIEISGMLQLNQIKFQGGTRMKKKLYSAILASIMVIGSICGVAIPVYAKEETKIIDGNDSYDTATYLDVNGSYSDVLSDSNDVDFYKLIPDSNGKLSINFGHVF